MVTLLLIALTALVPLLLLVYLRLWRTRPANFPPGPPWRPLLGNTSLLRSLSRKLGGQHLALSQLAADYGTDVLGLKLGSELVVAVFTEPLVKEVLTREEFTGRPDTFFLKVRCFGSRRGVTCTDGPLWQEQRAFTVRHLKQLGFGKPVMENLILEELDELVQILSHSEGPVSLGLELSPSILSVLWALSAGKRLQRSDKRLQRLLQLLSLRTRAFDIAGGLLSQFPWLRFFAPDKSGYTILTKLNSELREFLMETINEHKARYVEGGGGEEGTDLIDSYLHEMEERKNDPKSTFTDDQLVMVLLDLFLAGAHTTSNTLDFAFLLLIRHPDVQENVFQEIRANIGLERQPLIADRARLPYTEAVLLEVQRLCHVTPITGPRRVLRDTTLNGYFIPKETTVLISQWSVHRNEVIFPDPTVFKPERFSNPLATSSPQDHLIPFGLGKRRCLGESLAKACIFLIFTGLVQKFRISTPANLELPSLEPLPGITLAPRPYQASLRPR